MKRTNWWDRLVERKLDSRRHRCRPEIELLEERCLMDTGFRSITGLGNNIANPSLGAAGTDLIRIAPSAYADGLNAPAGANLPGARTISNTLSDQTDPNNPSQDLNTVNQKLLSDYIYVFGQFLDHDLDLTKDNSGQPFDIPPGSPTDPMGTEPFTRSQFDPATGPISVDLSAAFNRTGIVNDGSTFTGGGLDHDGNALSANLLGSSVVFKFGTYAIGAAGVNDVVSAAGQTISLPATNAATVSFLATGVNGNQFNQPFRVTYTDGTSQTFTQSISDWFTPQNFSGESTAVTMPYRDTANGGMDNRTFQVYGYSFSVSIGKQVKSITLPNDRNVEVLAIDVTPNTPRQQVQSITSFIDGSQIYGSDPVTADALRTHSGGRLKDSIQGGAEFLPYNSTDTANGGIGTPIDMANDAHIVPDSALYAAGDRRGNENIELTSMQTLFLREHNRIADQLAAANPTWSDEQIYQMARRQVGAELEVITYNEWIPALLGPNALPAYTGYKPNVNPGIANEFSTAMFRFAHSELDNGVDRLNNDGTDIPDGSVDLAQAFFNPTLIQLPPVTDPFSGHVSTGISPILKGSASGNAQEVDLLAVRDVRNFLFGPPGAGGTDLIARDIQRGRDNGLTDYNSMRAAYGLPRVTSFAQITSNVTVQQELQQVYGNVNNIDAFVGALAEDHVAGADVGPLTKAVLVNQFTRLRDGDRFFYLNTFHDGELQNLLANTSLAKIIERNTAISNLQSNVFFFKVSISGTVFDDDNRDGRQDNGEHGFAAFTVQLKDDTGAVLSTTKTDANGFYLFNNFNGLSATGNYTVSVVVPTGFINTTPTSVTIQISRGDINADADFGLDRAWTSGFFAAPGAGATTSSSPTGAAAPVGASSSSSSATSPSSGSDMAALANTTGLGATGTSTPTSPSSGSSAPTRSASGANTGVDPSSVGGAQAGTTSSVSNQGVVPAPSSSSSSQPTSLSGVDPSNPLP
jgi:hypothetical protein